MLTNIEVEALHAVVGIRNALLEQKEIDWEQRRYEIAKEVFVKRLYESPESHTRFAIACADALIEELKKNASKYKK